MEFDEESSQRVKTEFEDGRPLNFATTPDEFDLTVLKKPKTIRDPMSHRIIEKRRRDRMNNCLADLSRLIPTNYLKQGQGRIEKTEIIEMAIKHIQNLTNLANKHGGLTSNLPDRYLGFKECQDEVMRYLVEVEGWDAMDQLCNRLMGHLQLAGEKYRAMNPDGTLDQKKDGVFIMNEDSCTSIPSSLDTNQKSDFGPRQPLFQQREQTPQNNTEAPQVLPGAAELEQFNNNFRNFLNADSTTQLTQEHLRRDKHLWTLLTKKCVPTETNQEDSSGISTGSGSCIMDSGNNMDSDKVSVTDSMQSSLKKDQGYKFKHNITKRFSQEKQVQPSDTSSSGSNEENKSKRKFHRCKARSPSSTDSSRYPNSESSQGNQSTDSGDSKGDYQPSSFLPGFVLHPNGTHYVPLSIHPSNIGSNIFGSKNGQASCVFHPISIPVNFGGPLLSLKKVRVRPLSHKAPEDEEKSAAESPSGTTEESSQKKMKCSF